MPFVATHEDLNHVQSEADKENRFIECIQHIHEQVHDILDRSNAKYKQRHDQHRVPHNFQVGDKVATFAKGAPRLTPSQASPASIWVVHHH
jgi:hypothetical protein